MPRLASPLRRAGSLLRALVVVLVTCAAASAAVPYLHYEGSRYLPLRSRWDPFLLRKHLYPALKQAGILRVELVAGDESVVQERSSSGMMYLDRLPSAALHAVLLVLPPEFIGAEIDVLIAGTGAAGDPDRIWTVRRDLLGGIVVLKGGPPLALEGPDPTPAQLEARFGIGALEDTDAIWSGDERRALQKALELLTPRELELVAGISFKRARRDRYDHPGSHAPSRLGEPSQITLFDRAFERIDGRPSYVGAPDRALPYAVSVLLHELGHVLARAERRKLLLDRREQVGRYDGLAARYGSTTREYTRTGYEDGASSSRRAELAAEIARSYRELELRRASIARLDAQLEPLRTGPSALERRYAALPGAREGPTAYGRIDARESFAEAFALYHLDPDSLRWIAPQVHAWFAASGHLNVENPALPKVAAPAEPKP